MTISQIYFFPFRSLFAVSGGVDSMALLHLAIKKIPLEGVVVAHFNHGLRGENSDADEALVRDFCIKNGIAFFSEKMDISALAKQERSSIEATARKYRYQFLEKIFRQEKCKICYTAHHLDDRIETAIFNLIRGTKFSGICSLKGDDVRKIDDSEKTLTIHRPFLRISKNEILKYAKRVKVPFREDESNENTELQRNFLRKEILPKFEKINVKYRDAIDDFIDYVEAFSVAQNLQATTWLINEMQKNEKIREKYRNIHKNIVEIFTISSFKDVDVLLQFAILEKIYKNANFGNFGLSDGLLDELMKFILEGKNSFGKKNVKNLHLERRGNYILILEPEKK